MTTLPPTSFAASYAARLRDEGKHEQAADFERRIAGPASGPTNRVVRRAQAVRVVAPPPPPAPKAMQRRNRRARKLQRLIRSADKYRSDWQDRCRERSIDPSLSVFIERAIWVKAWACMADPSGRVVRTHLRSMRNKVLAGAIRNAALCPLGNGLTRRHWTDADARITAALGIAFEALSSVTRRPGRWNLLVKGIPESTLCKLLRDPWSEHVPSRSALAGVHRPNASLETGHLGYLRRLEAAGALSTQQLREGNGAEPCELLGKRKQVRIGGVLRWVIFATNRYWLPTADTQRPMDVADRLELIALHTVGVQLADELRAQCERDDEQQQQREGIERPPPT